MKKGKRIMSIALAGALSLTTFVTGCNTKTNEAGNSSADATTKDAGEVAADTENNQSESKETNIPKYVFMFFGDGMSYPQVQLTYYFVSANSQDYARKVTV